MRLTFKFTAAVTCAILVVLGVNALIRLNRETALFEEEVRRDSRVLGRAVAGAAERIWTTVGLEEAIDLVEDAGKRVQGTVRWIWLDAEPGDDFAAEVDADKLQDLREPKRVVVRARNRQNGEQSLYTYVPLRVPHQRIGAIEVRESLAFEQEYIGKTILHTATTTGVLVLLCGSLVISLGIVLVARPVRGLVEQARRIGAGDLTSRLDVRQRDEIGDLAREMNAMGASLAEAHQKLEEETVARQNTEEMLRHADRLTTVGKLAAGIAHEIGTPLNVITGHAQLLAEDRDDSETIRETSLIIADQARRVAHIVRQLLDFARRRPPDKSRQDLRTVVEHVVTLLGSLANKQRVELELVRATEPMCADVDAGQIEQVVTNLLVNAMQASQPGGQVEVSVKRWKGPRPGGNTPGHWVCIDVVDSGTGMTDEVKERLFEPFFTTKEVGEGTGLGLSVAYGIVVEHGGWIDVDSTPGQGSRLSVHIPENDA